MLQIVLIDENSQNLLKMLQTERQQTSKLTKFQPNLQNLKNVFLNLNDYQLH